MNVLLLGGTGAIGTYLRDILNAYRIPTTISTRDPARLQEKIKYTNYVVGNAKDISFLAGICSSHWDVIVDFMAYTSTEFKERLDLLLNSTNQYIYISSARVYGNVEHLIRESSPRLLDCTKDKVYLSTDEYALSKARQENLLLKNNRKNFTIVRPYITYGNERFQMGVLEKEEWLYRAIHGRTVVFSKDIADKITTLTHGYDVAMGIYGLMERQDALGKVFHITNKNTLKWQQIIEIYSDLLKELLGIQIKVKYVTLPCFLSMRQEQLRYQVIYDRLFNRSFDTTNQSQYVSTEKFILAKDGLRDCLTAFIKHPVWKDINWHYEAIKDRETNEYTPLSEIKGLKNKLRYMVYRFHIKS